jgi:hypothetical protein
MAMLPITPSVMYKWKPGLGHREAADLIPLVTQLQIVMVLPFVLGLFYIKQRGDRTMQRVDLLAKASIIVGGLLVVWSFLLMLYVFPTFIFVDLGQALFGLFVSLAVWSGIIRDYLRMK